MTTESWTESQKGVPRFSVPIMTNATVIKLIAHLRLRVIDSKDLYANEVGVLPGAADIATLTLRRTLSMSASTGITQFEGLPELIG